jgi:hypothetical protein
MDDFSYLSVLLSIVLGLGITNLLTGLAAMVRRRARVKMYWPMPVWMVTLFLIHVQTWWAMFGLRNVGRWSFAAFLVVLLQPVLLFLMAALIVPDLESTGETIDLRVAYFRETRWFFAAFILTLCVSLAKDLVLSGHLPEPRNLAAHGVFFASATVGFISKSDGVQKFLAPLGLAMLVSYIALLFTTLPR